MFSILALSLLAFNPRAEANSPQLERMQCVATNGVKMDTVVSPRNSRSPLLVKAQWGLATKLFTASVQPSFNGMSLITLEGENETYQISVDLDASEPMQQASGKLMAPNRLWPAYPYILANISCHIWFRQ